MVLLLDIEFGVYENGMGYLMWYGLMDLSLHVFIAEYNSMEL